MSAAPVTRDPRAARPLTGRTRAGRVAGRLAGAVALLATAALVTTLDHIPATTAVVDTLTRYSPIHLAHGDVVALPGSMFLLARPRMLGPTTFFVVALFLPYALARGSRRALLTGLAGHCLSTLAVAAVALPGAALGWSVAVGVAHSSDYGASAALAAVAGGLTVVIARRAPELGSALLGAIAGFFLRDLVLHPVLMHRLADLEHLVALSVGVACEVPAR